MATIYVPSDAPGYVPIDAGRDVGRDPSVGPRDWCAALPELTIPGAVLREPRVEDAASLCALLTAHEVRRYLAPPPMTVEEFERFIQWTHGKRAAGEYACFAIVPDGLDMAVGLVQIQFLPDRAPAEWGFVLGSPFWGRGLFQAAAEAVLDFAFEEMGIEQLGARLATVNGRGNAALRKLGAVREALLPATDGRPFDEYYWTLSPEDRKGRARRQTSTRH